MTIYDNLIKSEFHDNTLVAINHTGSSVILTIEYYDEDDNEKSVEVLISGVDHIFRDDVLTQGFKMEADDGGIIALKQEREDVILLLDWCNYALKSNITCYYKILGATILLVSIQPTSGDYNPGQPKI